MNQLNAFHIDKLTDPPRDYNSQPPELHFKSWTCPPKTNYVVSSVMGRINHHSIDSSDVEVHPSEYPFKSTSEYVPDPDTTIIKSIDGDGMDKLLEFLYRRIPSILTLDSFPAQYD